MKKVIVESLKREELQPMVHDIFSRGIQEM